MAVLSQGMMQTLVFQRELVGEEKVNRQFRFEYLLPVCC